MKYITIILIGIILVLGIILYLRGCYKQHDINVTQSPIDQAKYDSLLTPHIRRIAQLQRAVTITKHAIQVTKEKAKSDSITYKKTISRLQKELAVTKYKGVPATVPDDSVQLAMDCLKKDPIRDSIDSVNYSHIATLEKEKVDLVKDYESIMDANQGERNELDSIINVKDQENKDILKTLDDQLQKNKKLRKRNKLLGVLIPVALVGGVLLAK